MQTTMVRWTWVFTLAWLVAMPTQAREVAGVDIAERVEVGGQPLILNGAGVRRKFFIRVYVGALYLPARAATGAEALAQDGPRRVTMQVLYDEISRQKLVDAWNDGFADNLSVDERQRLQPRIDRFNTLFDAVHAGDLITLDYLPGKGTVVSVSGRESGRIPGRDFNDALLRIWLGDHPADSTLKAAMLGD